MKKIIYVCLVVAIAVTMASCGNKTPEATPVAGDVYTFSEALPDGTPGVTLQIKGEDGKFRAAEDFVYTGAKFVGEAGLIQAFRDDGTFDLYKINGNRLRFESSFKSIRTEGDVVWLTDESDKPILYVPEKGYIFGPFAEIYLLGDKIVFKGLNAYGMYDFDYNYLIEAKYDRIYIINKQSDKKYDVLLCKGNEWSLIDQDNADYSPATTTKVLKLFMKKCKPDAPVGEFPLKY
ncbi:MAG: hypothetical protein IKN67_05425 [Alphaproteobacteria bacterium]|nr:hypothetical protein [Alphaproteobacteria bacterium]